MTTQPANSKNHASEKLISPRRADSKTPPTTAAMRNILDGDASSTRANKKSTRRVDNRPKSFHLPIRLTERSEKVSSGVPITIDTNWKIAAAISRSEEHTSELQSQFHL